ncbi:MAG: dihydropteroate synthase [Burkholderiales bacterium]|nr:dihydropteroate synthase [Burkholderiales bacterium]
MMNFALVKFRYKKDVRALLRQIKEYKLSSIYQLNLMRYILIASPNEMVGLHLPQLTIVEHELFEWAKSEIEQSVEFIRYESHSNHIENGRVWISPTGLAIRRTFEGLGEIFAILNYTADSFSDGGTYNTLAHAEQRILELIAHGAAVVDIGVESTRPGATKLTFEEEIRQLTPLLSILEKLKITHNFLVSIDTYHKETVLWLNDKNIDFINDVSGNLPIDVVKGCIESGKQYIAMHSLSVPASYEHILDVHTNPISYLSKWWINKAYQFDENNIDLSKVIFDPGIGFGKNNAQAWYIINNIHFLNNLEVAILLGHSRKSFIKHVLPLEPNERDEATNLITGLLINQVDYLRIHEIVNLKNTVSVLNHVQNLKKR